MSAESPTRPDARRGGDAARPNPAGSRVSAQPVVVQLVPRSSSGRGSMVVPAADRAVAAALLANPAVIGGRRGAYHSASHRADYQGRQVTALGGRSAADRGFIPLRQPLTTSSGEALLTCTNRTAGGYNHSRRRPGHDSQGFQLQLVHLPGQMSFRCGWIGSNHRDRAWF